MARRASRLGGGRLCFRPSLPRAANAHRPFRHPPPLRFSESTRLQNPEACMYMHVDHPGSQPFLQSGCSSVQCLRSPTYPTTAVGLPFFLRTSRSRDRDRPRNPWILQGPHLLRTPSPIRRPRSALPPIRLALSHLRGESESHLVIPRHSQVIIMLARSLRVFKLLPPSWNY